MDYQGQQQAAGPAVGEIEETNADLLKVTENAQLFLGKTGYLSPGQYAEFWLGPKIASLGTVLLSRILMTLTGEDKTSSLGEIVKKITSNAIPPVPDLTKLPELDAEGMSQLQSLILTSYYSALLYPFNANFAPLRAALGRLVSFRQKTKAIAPNTPDFHFISEVERMFATRDYLNSAESLRFCIQQATNIDFPEDFDINKASARLVAPSLIYSYFRLRMLEPQRARETIEACLAVMDHASITDESVLSLLFMLRTFIPYCPIPPTDLYHKLVERVTKFYLWPQPYSDCARDLLELLNVEIKSPGTAMRARIHEESPSVYPIATSGVLTGKERLIHLLIDKDVPQARWLQDMLKNFVPNRPQDADLQLRIIMSVFMSSLSGCTPDQLGLEYLPKEHINHFYGRIMQAMDQAAAMPAEADAVKYREEQLAKIKEEILHSLTQQQASYPPRPPRVPSVEFLFRVGGFANATQTKDSSYNTRFWYPKRESTEMLGNLLREYIPFANPAYRPLVKIGIVGTDTTMHNLVCGYVCLRLQQPELFERLEVRFFFIPVANTEFGNYLGTVDKWYGSHVIELTRAITQLAPSLQIPQNATPGTFGETTQQQPSEVERAVRSGRAVSISPALLSANNSPYSMHSAFSQDPSEQLERVVTPSSILRSELETYFREAKWPLHINIYRAECSSSDNSSITLPFFARAQLGLYAYAEVFRKQQDLPATMSRDEVVAHPKFSFKPISFQVKYLQMNPLSQARAIGQQDYRPYQQINMCSIPTPGDKAMNINADPTHPWVELVLVDDPSRKKAGQRSDPRVYHVSQVEIISERVEPFHLLLDGRAYGPFVKVKITGAMYPDKDKIFTMPFMSFLPVDLGD